MLEPMPLVGKIFFGVLIAVVIYAALFGFRKK
jgi:hypothetical protein